LLEILRWIRYDCALTNGCVPYRYHVSVDRPADHIIETALDGIIWSDYRIA
jgi:hypothetical protein